MLQQGVWSGMSDLPEDVAILEGPATASERLSPERLGRARSALRGYYRWLRLSRLALGAFFVFAAIFIAWLVPWLPSGLDSDDYTPEMAFTIYLLGGAVFIGLLALTFREFARRDRESLLVWASVFDEATGLHNRAYLFDRLALECERAQRSGRPFTLFVLQTRLASGKREHEPALTSNVQEKIAALIDSITHPTDVVALLSPNELAVLAFGVGRDERQAIQHRLQKAVDAELLKLIETSSVIDVKVGAATYGANGIDPSTLVQAGRSGALLAVPRRTNVA
jgi:GGDEF domain-containing protein